MRKWHVLITECLLKLTIISVILNIGSLKLMYFNDMHLFVDNFLPYSFTGVQVLQLYKVLHVYIGIWLEYYGKLKL